MKKEQDDKLDKIFLSLSDEKEILGVKIDKTLIKQFARRIYDTIKEEIILDHEQTEILLNAIFGKVKEEIDKLSK